MMMLTTDRSGEERRGRKEVREGEWGRGKEVEGSGENDYLPLP